MTAVAKVGKRFEARRVPQPPVEVYSRTRKAAFLLENAVDAEDYARAVDEVRKLGLDPAAIPHQRP